MDGCKKGDAEAAGVMKSGPLDAATINLFRIDLGVRLFALASTVAAMIVMVTAKETKTLEVPLLPFPITVTAKFSYSPAFVYLVVANCVASLYNIFAAVASAQSLPKACPSIHTLLYLVVFDTLMAGLMASATGASTAIAYVGLKGNSHVQWNKICDVYGGFCHHVGSSSALSLIASICFILLIMVSTYSIYRRSR